MEYSWKINPINEQQKNEALQLSQALKIDAVMARMLVQRSITNAQQAQDFFRPSLEKLVDPFLMNDMEQAVERLHEAILKHENILVYGDYDVDGITAVALVYRFLSNLTKNLLFYIPDRYSEGYGISFQGIDFAHEKKCSLIIALDCGIKEMNKVEYATQKGIDFIICDHHLPKGDIIPNAVAVLDAKRNDNTYPFTELSGCGVGYKFMCAYALKHKISLEAFDSLYELLALSIAVDIVPIVSENRILAYYGLKQINEHPCVGIQKLIDLSALNGKNIDIHDLGFRLGPRINASGRINLGIKAVHLLITSDNDEAVAYAKEIEEYNTERQTLQSSLYQEAVEHLKNDANNEGKKTTVVYSPDWHRSVAGIVASKLTETFYRPTIVLADFNDELISGSARSVGDFNIHDAICACSDLLTHFGGHHFAAGLSMKRENLELFQQRFEEYVQTHINQEQQSPTINIEMELQLSDITPRFVKFLYCLEPCGPENPAPLFVTRNLLNFKNTRRVGTNGEHLRVELTDGQNVISGIGFGMGDFAERILKGEKIDVCYAVQENTFNGKTTTQMMIKDIHFKS